MCGIGWLVRWVFWFGALILFGGLVCLVTFDFGRFRFGLVGIVFSGLWFGGFSWCGL